MPEKKDQVREATERETGRGKDGKASTPKTVIPGETTDATRRETGR